ncbi:acyl-CoA dehydrogenase family protein, partial [Mycobacterium avium]
SIAMSEPAAGSDLAGIKTTARDEGDHWVVNGQKTFISNGLLSKLVLTAVKTDPSARHKGISLLMIEDGMEGFTRGRKLDKIGQYSADTAELFFEDVKVPKENLVGELNRG